MEKIEFELRKLYPNVNPNDNVIFIGFDPRETMAYMIAKHSIESRSPGVKVFPLYAKALRQAGVYSRPLLVEGATGQFFDITENRPHSVEFSFTRFLVPSIARILNIKGWVMFADCDFLFRFNLNNLFDELKKAHSYPLALVKHNFKPTVQKKMDGVEQKNYNMKLWSAFMCFNTNHPLLNPLTPSFVNTANGMDLHQFTWLKDSSGEWDLESIFALPENYQTIPGHKDPNGYWDETKPPMIIHYTEKAPWFHGEMQKTLFSEEWWDEVEQFKTTVASTSKYTRFWE